MTEAGGRVPDILRHILSAAALLASHSATLAPARAVVDAARSGQLDAKRLDKLIAEAALAQMIANYRGELRRDSERLFVAEFHRALADGSADAVLNSLRPQFDEHAEAITASRAMINTESSVEHILASAEPSMVTAWQSLEGHLAVIGKIGAIASSFGPRLGSFPLIREFALGDGFRLDDRAIMCADGALEADSSAFRQPDSWHRTSPWFRIPLRLHTMSSAQARYNAWAAVQFDHIHSGARQSWVDEHGQLHERPRPTNPFRETEPTT